MDADDGFPILEDISDEQALDRLEQLLDASNDLPDLDSGVLIGSESHGVSSSVDGLDFGQELFTTPTSNASNTPHYASLPSPGGPLLNQKMSSYHGGPGSVGSQPPPSPMQQQSPMHHHMQQSPASSVPPSPAQFTAPSPASHCPPSPGSAQLSMKSPQPLLPPPSPANILYAKSPASHPPPPSPGLRSTPGPPVLSPQPASIQSQPPTPGSIYSAPSPTHPNILMGHSIAPGTVLTSHQLGMPNMQHLQLQPTSLVSATPQPMFQIQIQPNVSMQGLTASSQAVTTKLQPATSQQPVPITPNKGSKQPQLLPKPAQATSINSPTGRPGTRPAMQPPAMTTLATVAGQQPIIINQAGVITTMAQNSPLLMGQMMPGTGSTPFFIQQQSGAPLMIMRPNAPTLQGTPTLVPLQQSTGQQTIYLQQAPQPGSLITNQPQVKLITPQGRMQMQQIQTPTGPKFIAVPLGQTLLPGQNIINPSGSNMQLTPTLTASGQIQFQATPNISLSSAPILTNTSQAYTLQVTQAGNQLIQTTPFTTAVVASSQVPRSSSYLQSSSGGVTTVVSSLQGTYPVTSSNQIAGQSVIQSSQNSSLDLPQQSLPVSPSKKKKSKKKRRDPRDESPPKSGTVDLGALMKDVGLDIGDGFGMDDDFGTMDSESVLVSESSQNASSSLNSSLDSTSSSSSDTPQIISSMPISSLGPAPLQSTISPISMAPLTTQLTAPQFVTSQLGSLAPQQLRLAAPPQLMTPQLTASSSLQLVQGPDGQFILQTNPAPGIISQPVSVDTSGAPLPNPTIHPATVQQDSLSSSNGAPSPSQKSSPRPPVRPRPMPDPSRTPLFEDDTLPQGWHRKVSQRKSGASAGRYEVFIIGPTQKRFRSRNELKNFFEKTGETTLNPDDFDFSTFGRNNPKGPTSSGPTAIVSTLGQSSQSITPTFSVASAAPTYSVPTASVASSSVIVTTSPILPVTMPPAIQGSLSRSSLPPTSTITSLPTSSTTAPAVSAQEYDLIKNLQRDLEVTGMASVAAAKALEGTANQILPPTRNILLQNIQQPLPPSSLAGHHLPPSSLSAHPLPPISLPGHPLPPSSLSAHPLPPSSLPGHPLPPTSLAGPGMGLQISLPTQPSGSRHLPPNLPPLQTSGVPAPSSLSPTTPSTAGIQDADDQISRLLITMQQQTGVKLPDEDKVAAFIHSLTESGDSKGTSFPNVQSPSSRPKNQSGDRLRPPLRSPGRSPIPPLSRSPAPSFAPSAIRSQGAIVNPRSISPGPPTMRPHSPGLRPSHKPSSGIGAPEEGLPGSPSMPVLTPQISLPTSASKPQDTTFQNSYLDSLSKSQISDPKKSRLRNSSGLPSLGSPVPNMPMLSPTTGILHSPSSESPSPLPPQGQQSHIVNKSSAHPSPGGFGVIQQVPRSESQPSAPPAISGPPNVTVQASVPQPNLLGGPGSQIRALQHPSNLPPNTRLVRGPNGQVTLQKIQTIELTQEMQATFRAVATRIAEIERQAVKTPQDESDLARLYSKQQHILSSGRPVPATLPAPVTQVPTTMPSATLPKPSVPIRYTHSVGNKEISIPAGPVGPVLPPPGLPLPIRPPSSNSSVPPLTDQQKRIVAEFKSKIATLPPDQQQAYIVQNKLNLIKQLNFQPSQLQALQGTRPIVPPPRPPNLPPQIPVLAPANMAPPNLLSIKPPPPTQTLLNPPTLVPQGVSLPMNPLPVEMPERSRPPAMCPAINKSKKIAWVESQIKKDQQEAVNPNFKTPFRSKEDACKRLLRYHVFDDTDIESADLDQLDQDFEIKSQFLLTKYQAMLSRYHFLLLQESTRQVSSSEEVMLGRQWVAAEKQDLAKEKEELIQINNRLDELRALETRTEEQLQEETELLKKLKPDFPGVPNSWSDKFEEVMGRPLKDEITAKDDSYNDDTVRWDNSETEDAAKSNKELDHRGESSKLNELKDHKEEYVEGSDINWGSSERSRQDSGSKLKGLRVSLTNVMSQRGVKRELEETGSLISMSPRPDSIEPSSPGSDSHHIGLKFNRTMSGRWSAQLKQDDEDSEENEDDDYDEFSAIHNHLSGFNSRSGEEGGSVYSGSPLFEPPSKILRKSNESDDDQDFSLADVAGSSAAVGYLVDDINDDVDLRFNSPSAASLERFGSTTPSRFGVDCATPNLDSEPADNDSVQNAINSILDLPDRGGVQTPDDLNNLTGLLDSMESDEVDPSLDAAVASIQGLM